MMTSRFGLQCSDSEHSAIILCMQEQQCVAMRLQVTHKPTHTHLQIDEHDDLESIILYVYGPIYYDS